MNTIRMRTVVLTLLFLAMPLVFLGAQEILFSVDGSLGPGDDTDGAGNYKDVYRVRVNEGTVIEVMVSSDTLDSQIDAVLPNGTVIYNDDYQGFNAGFSSMITRTGQMEFTVSSLYGDEEGDYRVVVSELPPPREIAMDSVIEGRFGKSSRGSRRADRYILYGKAGTRVVIELRSSDFDSYLEIADSLGNQDYNDDGAGDLDSRLSYQFDEDGFVTITATSIGGDAMGSYTLSVATAADTVIAEYRGDLSYSDPRGYDGTVYDVYEYEGTAGSSVSILLESDVFDARLFVSNVDGSNLGSDDDGGGGTDSMVSLTLPQDGTYRIYVTSFFESLGAYRLQIME